ncbi:uncharacterized protein V1510DRAFT_412201 [Dipodascopsis tothii]|uniref:uncharacterized protein n=1 Tax=Dipodascopsis tothii TaxID=44089 RepID=UPI0034CDFAAB
MPGKRRRSEEVDSAATSPDSWYEATEVVESEYSDRPLDSDDDEVATASDSDLSVSTPASDRFPRAALKRLRSFGLDNDSDEADQADSIFDLFASPTLPEFEASTAAFIENFDDGDSTDEDLPVLAPTTKTVRAPSASPQVEPMHQAAGPVSFSAGIQAVLPVAVRWNPMSRQYAAQQHQLERKRHDKSRASALAQQHLRRQHLSAAQRRAAAKNQSPPAPQQASLDSLLEEIFDIKSVSDDDEDSLSVPASPSGKSEFWIDRYTTIPICGYLNRTTVESVSAPAAAYMKKSAALRKRSLFLGKGQEMVGLGVMVGDYSI